MHFLIMADIGSAFLAITKQFAGYLGAALAFVLMVAGYTYMFALDDHNKAAQAKRAIGAGVIGAIIVALAIFLGPSIAKLIAQ